MENIKAVIAPLKSTFERKWGIVFEYDLNALCDQACIKPISVRPDILSRLGALPEAVDGTIEIINPGDAIEPHFNEENEVEIVIGGNGWLLRVDPVTNIVEAHLIKDGRIKGDYHIFTNPAGTIKGYKAAPDSKLVLVTFSSPPWTGDFPINDQNLLDFFHSLPTLLPLQEA